VNVDHHFRGRPIAQLASLLLSLLLNFRSRVMAAIDRFRTSFIAAAVPRSAVFVSVRKPTRR
jgi:hypothetical protein